MLCAMGKPCSFFPNTLQAKESLHHVMTVLARTLHVAWVDEGKKKDYLLEMKMRKLGPATVHDLHLLATFFYLQ